MFDGDIWLWDRCWRLNIRENIGWKWWEEKKSDHVTIGLIRRKKNPVYIHSKPNFTLGGKEEGRLWHLEQAVLTALAHGVSSAIIFRNILMEDIMRFTSLLLCLWRTKKMAISERAETEMCFPSILLERRVSKEGGGWWWRNRREIL